MRLRIAACQTLGSPDIKKSMEIMEGYIKEAAEKGVDVITFPEAHLCGYQCSEEYWALADARDFLDAEEHIVSLSREYNIAVIFGTANKTPKGWENSLLVIDKGGCVRGRYAKTHLAEDWSIPGSGMPVYEVCGIKSCFIICHDIRYPELVRLPAIAGAQICYFCSCESGIMETYKKSAYHSMPVSRAAENAIYLIMTNAPADPDNLRGKSQSHGNSKIIDPDGNVLAEAGNFDTGLIISDIDTDNARRTWALRSRNDETFLAEWMRSGEKIVDIG